MVQLTTFIIGIVAVGLLMGGLSIFIVDIATVYNKDDSQINLSEYNRLQDVSSFANKTEKATESVGTKQNALDVIGEYFTSAYQALTVTKDSLSIFKDVSKKGIEEANLGSGANLFYAAIVTIVIVLIIIGVFLSAILKRDL